MRCQMMRVISSPSISTTGFFTLIFAIADEPLRARICDGRSVECLRTPALWRGGAHPARTKHMRAELRARTRRAIVRALAGAALARGARGDTAVGLTKNADMARDSRCIWPPPPGASAGDARTGSGRPAGAARRRHERARRARTPRAVRARRRALLRRSERPRSRCLADVARRLAAPRDRCRGRRIVRRAAL